MRCKNIIYQNNFELKITTSKFILHNGNKIGDSSLNQSLSKKRMEISLGILTILAIVILAYFAVKIGYVRTIGSSINTVVWFNDAAGLVEGAAVKVAGVQIGNVESLNVDFNRAKAVLRLDKNANIRKDAVALVRARSLLGEKYVEIIPSSRTADLLLNNSTISTIPNSPELDQVIGQVSPLMQSIDTNQIQSLINSAKDFANKNSNPAQNIISQVDSILNKIESINIDDPKMISDLKNTIHNLSLLSEKSVSLVSLLQKESPELAKEGKQVLQRMDNLIKKFDPIVEKLPKTMERLDTTFVNIERLIKKTEPQISRLDDLNYNFIKKLLREEGLLIRLKETNTKEQKNEVSNSINASSEEKQLNKKNK